MDLKDCTKDELLWYLTEKMMIDHRRALIEIVHRRWEEQEDLCERLRDQSLEALLAFVAAYKSKPYSEMTDSEAKNVLALARKHEEKDKAVKAAEKKSNLLYKQLNALYGIE